MDEQDLLNMIPLDESTAKLADQIVKETDIDKTKQLLNAFNLNQSKKNVIRILKLETLLDKVQDSMIERFDKVPNNFNNADLLNYMQTVQASIDRANKSLNTIDDAPAIQMNQLNINVEAESKLDRESRTKVTEAVASIMKKLKLGKMSETDTNSDTNIVLLNNEDDLKGDA